MAKALIIGSRGQDGVYLDRFLAKKGYQRIGISRQGIEGSHSALYPSFVFNREQLDRLLAAEQPGEIYHLAAFQRSSEDPPLEFGEFLSKSFETNTLAFASLLEAVQRSCPVSRVFYAASSQVFGEPLSLVQTEDTPFDPVDAYGISKAAAIQVSRSFRKRHGLFASAGILFNHDSPYRPARFLSRKVIQAAVAIKRGKRSGLTLGRLDALIDWGFAGDYVQAMWQVLQLPVAGEFVIATGQLHSVRDFVATAFGLLDLDWTQYISEQPMLLTKPPVTLRGDSTKLREASGWTPQTSFDEMIKMMIEAELELA